jgi:hypothetical protein
MEQTAHAMTMKTFQGFLEASVNDREFMLTELVIQVGIVSGTLGPSS